MLEAVASNSISCLFMAVIAHCLNPSQPLVRSSAVANCFQSGVIIHNAARIVSMHASVQHTLSILWGIYLVEFLGHVVTLFNIFKELSNCFAQGPRHFTSPMATTFSSYPTHPHQHRYGLLCCPVALWVCEFPSDQQY